MPQGVEHDEISKVWRWPPQVVFPLMPQGVEYILDKIRERYRVFVRASELVVPPFRD